MKAVPIAGDMTNAIVSELGQSPFFKDLTPDDLKKIAGQARLLQFDPGETIMEQGAPSDSFFLIVSGEVIIRVRHTKTEEPVEVARIKPFDTIGELGPILGQPRSASAEAGQDVMLLRFDEKFFNDMFKTLPGFGLVTCRVLAKRLQQSSRKIPLSQSNVDAHQISDDAKRLLPADFLQRHRILPIKVEGNVLHLGFVDDPSPQVINAVREKLPGMELRPVSVDTAVFNAAMQQQVKVSLKPRAAAAAPAPGVASKSPALDDMLRRMVAEGASDIHLSSGQQTRWRIDGDMQDMPGMEIPAEAAIMALMEPTMPQRNIKQFKEDNDTDFAYAIPGVSRFRVNMFRDQKGAGVVFRQIPDKILTIEQLGLPAVVTQLCNFPKGLILVTGPTGSGKSTTLAAMVDHVNKARMDHIITLEDPIEFVHMSQKCMVNQREVGPHTTSFSRALRAALREDPDIVLVGEMRDLETVALALETANTGHLVFGTLHTNTAVSTIARVIDMFPAAQQNQIRGVLADSLKGVVAQTLCKRIGGGRAAALEILVSDTGIASLIREGKTHQILSIMQTGKAKGNRLLNDELVRMVQEKVIAPEEANTKAVDKDDLAQKLKTAGLV